MPRDAAAISPTAHYTGRVWLRHGLSHPALATLEGQALHAGGRGPQLLLRAIGAPTLEDFLLARHRLIDLRLAAAIESGAVTQVIELAAGLSPRGWRFRTRFGASLDYVEADLPGMAARKRGALARIGGDALPRVLDVDAFADSGALILDRIVETLDPRQGLAIVTEGLLNYFPTDAVRGLWARLATVLGRFPRGLYLSDIHLAVDNRGAVTRAFLQGLSAFVRGRVFLHFDSLAAASHALTDAGFSSAELLEPVDFADVIPEATRPGAKRVRVIDARIGDWRRNRCSSRASRPGLTP